jgi:hypothetical protein
MAPPSECPVTWIPLAQYWEARAHSQLPHVGLLLSNSYCV